MPHRSVSFRSGRVHLTRKSGRRCQRPTPIPGLPMFTPTAVFSSTDRFTWIPWVLSSSAPSSTSSWSANDGGRVGHRPRLDRVARVTADTDLARAEHVGVGDRRRAGSGHRPPPAGVRLAVVAPSMSVQVCMSIDLAHCHTWSVTPPSWIGERWPRGPGQPAAGTGLQAVMKPTEPSSSTLVTVTTTIFAAAGGLYSHVVHVPVRKRTDQIPTAGLLVVGLRALEGEHAAPRS